MFYKNYLTSDFHTNTFFFQARLPTGQNDVGNRYKAYLKCAQNVSRKADQL